MSHATRGDLFSRRVEEIVKSTRTFLLLPVNRETFVAGVSVNIGIGRAHGACCIFLGGNVRGLTYEGGMTPFARIPILAFASSSSKVEISMRQPKELP